MGEAARPILRRSPLDAEHRALGARMVEFGGWGMPIQYSGVLDPVDALVVDDITDERAVIAVQGPLARERVRAVDWNGIECIAAGTGYTGEGGIEIQVPAADAPVLWNAVIAERDRGVSRRTSRTARPLGSTPGALASGPRS